MDYIFLILPLLIFKMSEYYFFSALSKSCFILFLYILYFISLYELLILMLFLYNLFFIFIDCFSPCESQGFLSLYLVLISFLGKQVS